MSIETELAGWDGKSTIDIDRTYTRHGKGASFVPKIIHLLQQLDKQKGATWLLKRHLENGRKLTTKETAAVFKLLPRLEQWETKLHILQCLSYIKIDNTEKKDVELFLRQCLADSNKFVRAWAYNGFNEISRQYPEYEEEAMHILHSP